ncbi:tyrosinase family oxidase copper chaperone [Streptomyces sp. NPDC059917]|uniref:apotyrosinase chaperone MelC1 n=1 Tax=Streptomyces sp. NPDC059917 TaxID=3347002 RepID=UPI0036566DDD
MNQITRRRALGTTAGALSVLGIAATAHAATLPATATVPAPRTGDTLDEVYMGRRIRISPAQGGGHHGGHHSPGTPTVRIDGAELHVMRNADTTWISVVNHYETFADLPSLARAAVRELQGAVLVPMGGM